MHSHMHPYTAPYRIVLSPHEFPCVSSESVTPPPQILQTNTYLLSILVVLPFQKYHTKWPRTHVVFLVWFPIFSKNECVSSGIHSILLLNHVSLYGCTTIYFICWLTLTFSNREQSGYKGFVPVFSSVQFSLVAQSCPTLCDPMNRSTPGLPVHHQLPEFTQTHVHRVGNAIQPSRPLSPSPPAPNPSQHQGLFQWVNSSREVAKVLEFQLQHQSFQWIPISFGMDWLDLLAVQGTLKSLLQQHSS